MSGYKFISEQEKDGELTVNITYGGKVSVIINSIKIAVFDPKLNLQKTNRTPESLETTKRQFSTRKNKNENCKRVYLHEEDVSGEEPEDSDIERNPEDLGITTLRVRK